MEYIILYITIILFSVYLIKILIPPRSKRPKTKPKSNADNVIRSILNDQSKEILVEFIIELIPKKTKEQIVKRREKNETKI